MERCNCANRCTGRGRTLWAPLLSEIRPLCPKRLTALHVHCSMRFTAFGLQVEEGCRQLQQLVERGAFHAASSNRKGRSGRSSVGPDGHDTSGSAGTATASDPGAAAPGDDSGRAMAGSSPCTSAGGIGSASVPWEELFGLLSDDRLLERDPERLPKTGYGAEFEARVSGIFVQASSLCTRLALGGLVLIAHAAAVWHVSERGQHVGMAGRRVPTPGTFRAAPCSLGGPPAVCLRVQRLGVLIGDCLQRGCPRHALPCSLWTRLGAPLARAARSCWRCGETAVRSCGKNTWHRMAAGSRCSTLFESARTARGAACAGPAVKRPLPRAPMVAFAGRTCMRSSRQVDIAPPIEGADVVGAVTLLERGITAEMAV